METRRSWNPGRLVVVSQRRWVQDAFETACQEQGIEVVRSLGLDLPHRLTGDEAWWAPTEHAAHLLASGVKVRLSAPGPYLLDQISEAHPDLTRRRVWAGTLAELAEQPESSGWCKPAELKHPHVEAAWWESTAAFHEHARGHLPESTVVQVADARLEIQSEWRCYATRTGVHAVGQYLTRDEDGRERTWDGDDQDVTPEAGEAKRAAEGVLERLRSTGHLPPGSSVDLARLKDGEWALLELNPAWSSNPYGCNMAGVLQTVLASQGPSVPDEWTWKVDPHLEARAARMQPLR